MLKQIMAPVVSNSPLTGDYWLLDVDAPTIAGDLRPGQFVNIRIEGRLAPFTRRPFSVYRLSKDRHRLQVAYKLVGEGTRLMMETMPPGASPSSDGESALRRFPPWSTRRSPRASKFMDFSARGRGRTSSPWTSSRSWDVRSSPTPTKSRMFAP
jgi:hypothetical protein